MAAISLSMIIHEMLVIGQAEPWKAFHDLAMIMERVPWFSLNHGEHTMASYAGKLKVQKLLREMNWKQIKNNTLIECYLTLIDQLVSSKFNIASPSATPRMCDGVFGLRKDLWPSYGRNSCRLPQPDHPDRWDSTRTPNLKTVFTDGIQSGVFTFVPPGVSQAAACDGLVYSINYNGQNLGMQGYALSLFED